MSITLLCLVKGNLPANAFAVDIDSGKLVSHLKEVIKAKKQNDFTSVDADKLKVWKVEIPDDRDDELADPALQDELLATKKISKYFPSPPAEECIHVIVEHQCQLPLRVVSRNCLTNANTAQYIYEFDVVVSPK